MEMVLEVNLMMLRSFRDHLGPCTICNYLGAKRYKKKYMKMASHSNLEIWSPFGPKTHPGPKNDLKMTEGSQNLT